MSNTSPWLVTYQRNPSADRRVVCFPHAGGSASFYRAWAQHLGPDVELQAVQYPGRENRLAEPLMASMGELAAGAAEALGADRRRETILFGHSMGAAVAYESLRLLEAAGTSRVTRLCVSGRELAGSCEPVGSGPRGDDDLLATMADLGGTRSAVLDDPDLRAMVLDIIRNDYHLLDTYRPDPEATPVGSDVVALTGDRDPQVDVAMVKAWKSVTTGAFSLRVFPGDHFYLTSHVRSLLEIATARQRDHPSPAAS
ncbi:MULTISPECIES: thioesterase II family protein [unclassified Streptomyces]|uniref:thioesterase II family protein n=1 Tax=unclassified Streptomyces TaxID=2593676 RepID=UPI0007C4A452|nr:MULTISPECIES: thioesterase domain-containing protein [unclassified Streptomyces]